MAFADQEFPAFKAQLAKLTAAGVLGFHTHFEVIEVFGEQKGKPPANVFSILVAEERASTPDGAPKFLNPKRIKLKSLRGWTFGIKRSVKALSEIEQAFEHYHATGEWQPTGDQLQVGELAPIPLQFVPPDSTVTAAWNRVLKNNFWNGSYVIECADLKKESVQPFLDDPRRLQQLSETIQKLLPIRLASLSDRLGNVVVQIPISVVICKFGRNRVTGDCIVDLLWHPQATTRPLRASFEMEFDNVISSYVVGEIQAPQTVLPANPADGMQRGVIWDDQHQVILAATASTGFIDTIGFNMRLSNPEPRTFLLKDDGGVSAPVRVGLATSTKSVVNAPKARRNKDWINDRIYREEAAQLAATRFFVQYRPLPGEQKAEHEKALRDIRHLLSAYGEDGAWLWDPYLSAQDILRTLFFCPHANSDLRALTAAQEIPSGYRTQRAICNKLCDRLTQFRISKHQKLSTSEKFASDQRRLIQDTQSNLRGLRLEYRMKVGPSGWAFHDRFLIFPRKDAGALAWSLGTSVNSLGKQHHILQEVSDGQLVMEAFSELWDALSGNEHLIWKTP